MASICPRRCSNNEEPRLVTAEMSAIGDETDVLSRSTTTIRQQPIDSIEKVQIDFHSTIDQTSWIEISSLFLCWTSLQNRWKKFRTQLKDLLLDKKKKFYQTPSNQRTRKNSAILTTSVRSVRETRSWSFVCTSRFSIPSSAIWNPVNWERGWNDTCKTTVHCHEIKAIR